MIDVETQSMIFEAQYLSMLDSSDRDNILNPDITFKYFLELVDKV